jgi:hypothetical protein
MGLQLSHSLPHLTMNLTRFPSSHCHKTIPIFEDACIFVFSFVRMVKLDPVMFSIVHKKGEDNYDSLTWDEVFKRFVGKRIKTVFETFTRIKESKVNLAMFIVLYITN